MRKTNLMLNRGTLILLLALLLLAGCGRSVPVSYYQLAPVLGEGPAGKTLPAANLVIGIGPVRLQEYLDRPQLITRTGVTRLHLADRHRWAEPLADNIAWVVRDNLARLLSNEHLLLFPWERTAPVAYQISLEILHCEGAQDGSAQLEVLWTILDHENKTLRPPRRGTYHPPPATPDPEGLVSALSEGLGQLSQDIARELSSLPGNSRGRQP